MLEVFLFVAAAVLVVLFWPIFVVLGLVVLGLAIVAIVVGLALAFPKEAGQVVLAAATVGGVLGLIWIMARVLDETQALDKVAERVGAFVGRSVRALRQAHQRTRLKGPDG